MKVSYFVFLTYLLVTILSGCANTNATLNKPAQKNTISIDQQNIQNRKSMAVAYFKEQNYAAALKQWKILNTIYPDEHEFKNRIQVLEALIHRRAKIHIITGRKALAKKEYKTAETAALKVLAMNPTHRTALSMLRKVEKYREAQKQQTKPQIRSDKQFATRETNTPTSGVDTVKVSGRF